MPPWWKHAVIYQIYPRSFADGNGDGVGDLAGLRSRLDHLTWLGVDAVWLSPIFRSPMADFGYDVSDYCDVDPVFGQLADFDALVADAHAAGVRVMLDWVPNHSSDQHPWFVESRSSRASARRDWYYWRDEPNNWLAAFGGRAWTFDEATQQWYLHLFLPEQPDLNWGNPAVRDAMHDVLRFWLDRGVDGFRADVVHLIGKDPALPDLPLAARDQHRFTVVTTHDDPRTHELLRGIRGVLDSYPGDRAMVGEVNLMRPELLAPYYGTAAEPELNLVFNFTLLRAPWDASVWEGLVVDAERALGLVDGWPVWVLSNHDTPRHRTRYDGSEPRARVAAVVLLTLRGTPFLYAGEELGLLDGVVSAKERVDPGGRDGCRSPIPWDGSPEHGWGTADSGVTGPWLPFPPEASVRHPDALRSDPDSVLWLYRRLLSARRASAALHDGSWSVVPDTPEDVFAYERHSGSDRRVVVANFGESAESVDVGDGWVVEVATARSLEGSAWSGQLGPESAVVLRR
jgi:alpha-glucosidase